MTDKTLMLILKTCITVGMFLILLGIYLHHFSETIEAMGVKGIIISAMCVAIGMILSLPTKMPDPHQPFGQDMAELAANEFLACQRHLFMALTVSIVSTTHSECRWVLP